MKKSKVKPGVAAAPPGDGEFSLIPHSKLLDLYSAMLKCRLIRKVAPERRKRSLLISEAVTAGITIDLLPSDAISPAASDLTPCAIKGVALKTLLRWWSSPFDSVPADVARANVIPPSASAAARLEATLRLAAHFRSTNSGSVAVFFAGPEALRSKPAALDALSRKSLESSLRKAATEQLPILLVRQSDEDNEDFLSISEPCGVPRMVVDRDDVVAVYRVAFEALSHARRGNGPTLIDCKPWRPNGRAPKTRVPRDCIRRMKLYLAGKGVDSRSVKKQPVANSQ